MNVIDFEMKMFNACYNHYCKNWIYKWTLKCIEIIMQPFIMSRVILMD
jgi:hypothetical protein